MDNPGKDFLSGFRNPELVKRCAESLWRLDPGRELKFMHVCGTHENAVGQAGIRGLLPDYLKIIAGPGCPVCICPPEDIDFGVQVSKNPNIIVATYGDLLRVPAKISLMEAKSYGDIRVVYSIADAVEIAKNNPSKEVVFLAVGFETTACTTAAAIIDNPPDNFSCLLTHRQIPPALEALLKIEGLNLSGYLLPGHVMTVMGTIDYESFPSALKVPMAVAGFEPLDILLGLKSLVTQTIEGKFELFNAYRRSVRREGNVRAKEAIREVFEVCDGRWRGIGVIPESGLAFREKYRRFDASMRFEYKVDPDLLDIAEGCSCHLIMIGLVEPPECPLFGKLCVPEKPYGPCMVSSEGTCRSYYKYSMF